MASTKKGINRANGQGSLRFDPVRKVYEVRVFVDGKRRKVSAKTQAAAWQRAKELRSTPHESSGLPARPTVAEWLEFWRTTVLPKQPKTKQSSKDGYGWMVDHYLKPLIGKHKLTDLRPDHVQVMLDHMRTLPKGIDPKTKKAAVPPRPVAISTQRKALAVLRLALKHAVRGGLIDRNVAASEHFDGVGRQRTRSRSLTPVQAQALMAEIAASDPMTEALLTLLLTTGLRKGEALGLRWIDIDLATEKLEVRRMLTRVPSKPGVRGTMKIEESTKTEDSERIVELDPLTVGALKRWKVAQAEIRLACPTLPDGINWGLGFPQDLVFVGLGRRPKAEISPTVWPNCRGMALDLSRPNDMLDEITEKLGLGHWTVHELRHSAASLMLGSGVELHTVSRVLGHSSITVTADIYSHLVSGEKKAAAAALARVLTGRAGATTAT